MIEQHLDRRQSEELPTLVISCVPIVFTPLRDSLLDVFGAGERADILINNAATIAPIGATEGLEPSDVRASVALNLVAPILLAAGLLPQMKASGWGRIVNLSTGAVGNPGAMVGGGVYVATKAALEIATTSLAAEIDGSGVTANVYRPGMVDTGMQQFIRGQEGDAVARKLSDRFVGVQQKGILITPAAAAEGLLARLSGDDNGAIWAVDDRLR